MEVVTARGLSKMFLVRRDHAQDLKVRFLDFFHSRKREHPEELWALKEVDLTVSQGECVGLIGLNGSGKSTLLRLLAEIYPPTRGLLSVRGRVAPMLELGVGFHPDLSGRDNVYLNTAMFGLSNRETDRLYDAIVEFAGLAEFMDVPVKNYSNGMYMRLGFSVAVNLDADVFLIDEILAVGDRTFQDRCLERVREIRAGGRTILLVSHDMSLIERMCDRAYLLVGGRVMAEGEPRQVIERYGELSARAC